MERLSPSSPTIRTQICLPAEQHRRIIAALRKRARVRGKPRRQPNLSAWIREEGAKLIEKYS